MKSLQIAVGLVEFSKIASGIAGMDNAVKNNDVKLITADMVCPGKLLLVFGGKHAAVYEAVKQLESKYAEDMVHRKVIGNLSSGILDAAEEKNGCTEAVGIIELADAAGAIAAADEAVKTANVAVGKLRLANGVGGKGVVILTGGVSEVSAAVASAARTARALNKLIAEAVITNPDATTVERLYQF